MNETIEGKYTVTIAMPDVLTAAVWYRYAKAGRDHGEDDLTTCRYYQALTLIEGGSWTANGERHDLKAAGQDEVPAAVVLWVGNVVAQYVADQFVIEKKSSEPPSLPPSEAT